MKYQKTNKEAKYPELPVVFQSKGLYIKLCKDAKTTENNDELQKLFPNTWEMPLITFQKSTELVNHKPVNVGVILSGGPAPGGHNVISGLFDGLKSINPRCKLFGFLGGPGGFVAHKYKELTVETIDEYRNTGGFDIIGTGRTKLEKKEQFDKGLEILNKLKINSLVIIGGDDSNTNACFLAEYFASINAGVNVIGVPKTIDGDLKNKYIATSFGFDTATKVYSNLIGNIARDALSSQKYWHFIKLMGRSASHIALECALKTHPNITLISEESAKNNETLEGIALKIAEIIKLRSENGKDYGVVLIPEGLIEFIPETKELISNLNAILKSNELNFQIGLNLEEKLKIIVKALPNHLVKVLDTIPNHILEQFLGNHDSHGNLQVSMIESEKLLVGLVDDFLKEWKQKGLFKGNFNSQTHFLGYEGRCAAPSGFDANYSYVLGYTASVLAANNLNGYMAIVRNLTTSPKDWIPGGLPLSSLMNFEKRNGETKPVIKKSLVDLERKPFRKFATNRKQWETYDFYHFPYPVQYYGPAKITMQITETLRFEKIVH